MCAADLRLPNAACPIWRAGVLRVCSVAGRLLTKIGSRSTFVYILFPSALRTVIAPGKALLFRGGSRLLAGRSQASGLADRARVCGKMSVTSSPPVACATARRTRYWSASPTPTGDRLHDRPGRDQLLRHGPA